MIDTLYFSLINKNFNDFIIFIKIKKTIKINLIKQNNLKQDNYNMCIIIAFKDYRERFANTRLSGYQYR